MVVDPCGFLRETAVHEWLGLTASEPDEVLSLLCFLFALPDLFKNHRLEGHDSCSPRDQKVSCKQMQNHSSDADTADRAEAGEGAKILFYFLAGLGWSPASLITP